MYIIDLPPLIHDVLNFNLSVINQYAWLKKKIYDIPLLRYIELIKKKSYI